MNGTAQRGFTAGMGVAEVFAPGVQSVEKPFGHTLIELARQRSEIVGLTADLGKYTDIDIFGQEFPERYFQIGMAEQNLMGTAAGLARTGFIPFVTTYCVFATRRAYDYIAMDIALARKNVKIIAGLPGLTTGYGATHQAIDDLALMRSMPNMVVIDPCDATEIQQATRVIADYDGPVYMRSLRARVKVVLNPDEYRFEIGKARLLRPGKDVTLISTGLMTERTLEAAKRLSEAGIDCALLHVPTVKPLDRDAIVDAAELSRNVITLENHSTVNGLGSVVADTLCEAGLRVKFKKIGIPDCFVECGSLDYLNDKVGLSVQRIVEAVRALLS
jgi:transketolase